MSSVRNLLIVRADGTPPADLRLPRLRAIDATIVRLRSALAAYCSADLQVRVLDNLSSSAPDKFDGGLTVVYMIGHGWTSSADGQFRAAFRFATGSRVLTGAEIVAGINAFLVANQPLLLLVDTCEAAAIEPALELLCTCRLTAVFASAEGQRAWNLVPDGATRFALETCNVLLRSARRYSEIDPVQLAFEVRACMERDTSAPVQTVEYFVRGRGLRLSVVGSPTLEARHSRTSRRIRNALLGIGAGVATSIFVFAMYWHAHQFITIRLGDVTKLTEDAILRIYEEQPEENGHVLIDAIPASNERVLRRTVPATNLLIVFDAAYRDGRPREIRFHQVCKPGFFDKWLEIQFPTRDEVKARPGMAYISARAWKRGKAEVAGSPVKPFWIDIAPPTIRDYFPAMLAAFRSAEMQSYESILLSDALQYSDMTADQLRRVASLEELLARTKLEESLLSCADCPAPMTLVEAEQFMSSRGKRLPTAEEWELAVRGVDGRIYPWGNKEDGERINAGLPRAVGSAHGQRLRPVHELKPAESPFGLIDTVGNAADWVDDGSGMIFMGGEYKMNHEDCTTFSMMRLPASHEELVLPIWRVTCRGVLGSAEQILNTK